MSTIQTPPYHSWANMTPQEIETIIESKLEARFKPIEDKLDNINTLLHKLEGASMMIKTLFFVVAPIVGALVWIKKYVTFNI